LDLRYLITASWCNVGAHRNFLQNLLSELAN